MMKPVIFLLTGEEDFQRVLEDQLVSLATGQHSVGPSDRASVYHRPLEAVSGA